MKRKLTALQQEYRNLDRAVDLFARAMKIKLHRKARRDGFRGWDIRGNMPRVADMLIKHAARCYAQLGTAQTVDTANLAMMLWWNERRTLLQQKREFRAAQKVIKGAGLHRIKDDARPR